MRSYIFISFLVRVCQQRQRQSWTLKWRFQSRRSITGTTIKGQKSRARAQPMTNYRWGTHTADPPSCMTMLFLNCTLWFHARMQTCPIQLWIALCCLEYYFVMVHFGAEYDFWQLWTVITRETLCIICFFIMYICIAVTKCLAFEYSKIRQWSSYDHKFNMILYKCINMTTYGFGKWCFVYLGLIVNNLAL